MTVIEFIADKFIAFTGSAGIAVEMTFDPKDESSTRLAVTATGFKGRDAASQAVNAPEGFAIVLCDLKSLLETDQSCNMLRDKSVLITADRTDA